MKLEAFLVMIGLKLLVKGYLENTVRYTTPFKNSENSVMTQALIYLSREKLPGDEVRGEGAFAGSVELHFVICSFEH